ncbi:hypothetical protein EDB84DRAFT_1568400 [Lactarius hengduanensis]|nr:hypothetical protein EDB84DRAFT_1568400 [Lactarius hengduanensis]
MTLLVVSEDADISDGVAIAQNTIELCLHHTRAPLTICAYYPLHRLSPQILQFSASHSFSFLHICQAPGPFFPVQPESVRTHRSSTSPYGAAGCLAPPARTTSVANPVGSPIPRHNPCGCPYYDLGRDTRSTPRSRSSPNPPLPIPAARTPSSPNTTNADGTNADARSPLRCVERRTRTTTWNDLRRTFTLVAVTTALANRATLGPLPSGSEMYVLNHRHAHDHDPWLPSMADADAPQSMCRLPDAKGDVRVHCGWVFEDSFVENMCPWPDDQSKWLVVNFEGEDVLNYGGVSREWFFFLKHTDILSELPLLGTRQPYIQIDLAQGEHPDYFKFIDHVLSSPSDRFLSAHFVPGFSKMVLNRETNPKDLKVGHAVRHGRCN